MVSPLLGRFLVSFNLQSVICGLQSEVWSLQSAVCSLQMSYTTLSRCTYTTVFTVKKWRLNENTVSSEMCSECKKLGFAWNLDDSSKRYCKANIRKFSRGVHTEITVFSKLKTERNFNQQGQNVTEPESIFNSLMNLDVNCNGATSEYPATHALFKSPAPVVRGP